MGDVVALDLRVVGIVVRRQQRRARHVALVLDDGVVVLVVADSLVVDARVVSRFHEMAREQEIGYLQMPAVDGSSLVLDAVVLDSLEEIDKVGVVFSY